MSNRTASHNTIRATLAIDIGTHSVRAAAVDGCGNILCIAARNIELNNDSQTGHIEQDGVDIVTKTREAIAEILDQSFEFKSAGLAIQRSTVIAWDAQTGQPLHPAISWQDTRAAEFVSSLSPRTREIQSASGLVLSPHYGASKIRWLAHTLGQSEQIFIAPLVSFILFHLLDNRPYLCDESNAARTQLWDLSERHWSESLGIFFDVDITKLPSVKPVMSDYGNIRNTQIPLTAVCGDQNAAYRAQRQRIVEQQAAISEAAVVNLGTGAFILTEVPAATEPHRLLKSLAFSSHDECHYLLEATVNGAGSALEWAFDCWREERQMAGETFNIDREYFFSQLAGWWKAYKVPPVFINAIGGVGSPFWYSRLPSRFLIDENNIVSWEIKSVAVLESILFLLVINLRAIRLLGKTLNLLFCSGGLSKMDCFCQNLANLSELKVVRVEQAEATLAGIAILAQTSEDKLRCLDEGAYREFVPSTNSDSLLGLRERYARFRQTMEAVTE